MKIWAILLLVLDLIPEEEEEEEFEEKTEKAENHGIIKSSLITFNQSPEDLCIDSYSK